MYVVARGLPPRIPPGLLLGVPPVYPRSTSHCRPWVPSGLPPGIPSGVPPRYPLGYRLGTPGGTLAHPRAESQDLGIPSTDKTRHRHICFVEYRRLQFELWQFIIQVLGTHPACWGG